MVVRVEVGLQTLDPFVHGGRVDDVVEHDQQLSNFWIKGERLQPLAAPCVRKPDEGLGMHL